MRFTEHELTVALTETAKQLLAVKSKDVRKGRADIDQVWDSLDRYQRFRMLDGIGTKILPAMVALPDVVVEPGTRPTYTDEEIVAAVEDRLGDDGGRLRRRAEVAARVALLRVALEHLPPRRDPDALIVPDHL